MDASKNPKYLADTAEAVRIFITLFERFLELHVANTFARGMAPAVYPREDADPAAIAALRTQVDEAAGRAIEAPGLTNGFIGVQGVGAVDPIANWAGVTGPKPILEPANVLTMCRQIVGRLESLRAKAEAELPPELGAASMHPLIWASAKRLWRGENYKEAVAAASEALIGNVKALTGRNDVSETALWQEVFSDKPAAPGAPRLRWPGSPRDRSVSTMNAGLRSFSPGVQMTIRNGAAHGAGEMPAQLALERLSTLSLLARWVDECELVTDDAPGD